MKTEHRIEQIINNSVPAILKGEESIESLLAMYPKISTELRPRLEAALSLSEARSSTEPRPAFISSSRHNLEARIRLLAPHNFWQRFLRRTPPRRLAVNIISPAILLLVLLVVLNNLILTAHVSIPGDPFYTVKLVTEDIQLALTSDPLHKTDLYLQFTRERTTEFVELVLEGQYQDLPAAATRMESEIIAVLRSMNNIPATDLQQGHLTLNNLKDTLANEIFMLNVLKSTSPPTALAGIEQAIQAAQVGLIALR